MVISILVSRRGILGYILNSLLTIILENDLFNFVFLKTDHFVDMYIETYD